jgi:hypothetical protein
LGSLGVGDRSQNGQILNVTDNISVGYRKAGGKYVLASIDANKQFITDD